LAGSRSFEPAPGDIAAVKHCVECVDTAEEKTGERRLSRPFCRNGMRRGGNGIFRGVGYFDFMGANVENLREIVQ
jgi:hypothetical protein